MLNNFLWKTSFFDATQRKEFVGRVVTVARCVQSQILLPLFRLRDSLTKIDEMNTDEDSVMEKQKPESGKLICLFEKTTSTCSKEYSCRMSDDILPFSTFAFLKSVFRKFHVV